MANVPPDHPVSYPSVHAEPRRMAKPTRAQLVARLDKVRSLALDACEAGTDIDTHAVLTITGDDLDAFAEENAS